MNYFKQILERYFEKYPRLNEQEDPAARAQAEQLATQLITQAQSQQPPQPGQAPQSVPVSQDGSVYLSKSSEGNINLNGLGGFTYTVQTATGNKENGYEKLISYLMGSESSSPKKGKTDAGIEPLLGEPKQTKYSYLPDTQVADPTEVAKELEKICAEKIKNLSKRTPAKVRKDQDIACRLMVKESERLVNDIKGSIAQTLDSSKTLVTECDDEDFKKCKKEDESESEEHRVAAFTALQTAFEYLLRASKSEDKTLSIEECAFLKNRISLSSKGQKTVALIGEEKRGMLVTHDRRRTTFIYDSLSTLASNVKCADGKPFKFQDDIVKFLKQNGIGSSGSIVRGFFFEDLRAGIIALTSCKKKNKMSESECEKEAAKNFRRWDIKKENLTKALLEFMDTLKQNGELAVELGDDAGIQFITNVVGPAMQAGADLDETLGTLLRYMARTASLGAITRGPDSIFKTGTEVGFGYRSDMKECYDTEEGASAALSKMKLPEDQNKLVKVSRSTDSKCDGFTIGDSVKFSTSFESIKLGQGAASKFLEMMHNSDDSWRDMLDTFNSLGFSRSELRRVKSNIEEHQRNIEFLSNLPIGQYKNADGKRIKVTHRELAAQEIRDAIINELGVDNELSQEILGMSKKLIREGSDWNKISKELANFVTKAKLRNRLLSDDPKVVEEASREMAVLACFAGGAADGTLLSVADGRSGSMYTSAQNVYIQKYIEQASKLSKLSVEERKKLIKINAKSISIGDGLDLSMDGYDVEFHVSSELIKKNSSRQTIRRGQDPIKDSKNSNTNKILSLLLEQKETIESLINLISK